MKSQENTSIYAIDVTMNLGHDLYRCNIQEAIPLPSSHLVHWGIFGQ